MLSDALLDRIRAGYCVDHRAELDDGSITHKFDDAAAAVRDKRIYPLTLKFRQGRKGTCLVLFDEVGVADNISRQDRGEPPFSSRARHGGRSRPPTRLHVAMREPFDEPTFR